MSKMPGNGSIKNTPKRLRFSADDDLVLLREFLSINPLEDVEKWEELQRNVLITTKTFSIRTLKDHLYLMLNVWLKKDKDNIIRSGVGEVYSERDHLLQEISDMCSNANVQLIKKKHNVTKDKQIAELGRQAREKCASALKMRNEPKISSDHDYTQEYCPGNVEEHIEIPPLESDSIQEVEEIQNEVPSVMVEKARIPGPRKTKSNKSGTVRRSALEYLNQKQEGERALKRRQLDLEERRLNLEERKLILEEKKQEREMLESEKRMEMEMERFKLEIAERERNASIIVMQQKLIETLVEKLQK